MKRKPEIPTLTDDNFDRQIFESSIVLVKFGTEWSGACHMLMPVVEDLSETFAERCRFYLVDVEQAPQTAGRFDVSTFPTILILRDGEVLLRFSGVVSKNDLKQHLAELSEEEVNEEAF